MRVPSSRAARGALITAGVTVVAAVAVFIALTASGVGDGAGRVHRPTLKQAPKARPKTALQRYSEAVDLHENGSGVNGAPPPPESFPTPPSKFRGPFHDYRHYALRQLGVVGDHVRTLRAALAAGSRARARAAWQQAWGTYMRLGAVYGAFGDLDTKIDGQPGGLARGVHDRDFTGLHRLEYGLYGRESLASLKPVAARLSSDVVRLEHHVPKDAIDPQDFVLRAHEILEDAQRDLLSGVDVPWSHAGVLGLASSTAATDEVYGVLEPLFNNTDVTPRVDAAMKRLHGTLRTVHRAHHLAWPTVNDLSAHEREELEGSLGNALEALSGVPGALEIVNPPPIPKLPKR